MTNLMTPGEVADAFRVDPKTVSRWAAAGKIRSLKTPGGHHRFYRNEIELLLNNSGDWFADEVQP